MEQVVEKLKAAISGLQETSTKEVMQKGVYLYLDAVNPLMRNKDSVVMQIIIAEDSLSSAISRINTIRDSIRQMENTFNGQDIFKGLSAQEAGGMYVYAIVLEIEQYSDVLHGEVLHDEIFSN